MSALLPGLGQVYNKRYWKVPVIYAGLGAAYYFAQYNHRLYKKYKTVYIAKTKGDTSFDTDYPASPDQIRIKVDSERKNRDLMYIVCGIVYTLNIVDAMVDAHLYTFDVSDNLSLSFSPFPAYGTIIPGVNVSCRIPARHK